jgi:hypothetical protein
MTLAQFRIVTEYHDGSRFHWIWIGDVEVFRAISVRQPYVVRYFYDPFKPRGQPSSLSKNPNAIGTFATYSYSVPAYAANPEKRLADALDASPRRAIAMNAVVRLRDAMNAEAAGALSKNANVGRAFARDAYATSASAANPKEGLADSNDTSS